MVEVFKTNVNHQHHASMLVDHIQSVFTNYVVNFDLEDCDKILRVKCNGGEIKSARLIGLLQQLGFHAEVLPDEPRSLEDSSTAFAAININQLN